MNRVLIFLIVVFSLGFGFAWLADRPGNLALTWEGYAYEIPLFAAAALAVALVVATMILWWLIVSIWRSPKTVSGYFRGRRRDKGFAALSSGIIAAGAGDIATARKMATESQKLLGEDREPLLRLLDAQTAMLEGDHPAARAKFEAMLADPQTKMLGLRGLYLEAQQAGEREAAKHYAEQAVAEAPHLVWAGQAALELKSADHDWDGAIKLIETQKNTKQIGKDEAKRKRAVLLTAKALEVAESDPQTARTAASEAHKLAPDLAPAAVAAANACFRLGELRRGATILEEAWKRQPHPEIAAAYVHARSGDSVLDRLKRARKLAQLRPNHPESRMALGRAELDAGNHAAAREAVEAVLRMQPREGAYLLMADIEEAETGDQGRLRDWLGKAVKAARDPAWTADGYVSPNWAPFSPISGRIDAFEWKVPVEELAPVIDERIEVRGPTEPAKETVPALAAPPKIVEPTEIVPPVTATTTAVAAAPDAHANDAAGPALEGKPASSTTLSQAKEQAERDANGAADAAETAPAAPSEAAPAAAATASPQPAKDGRQPDDPGIDPDEPAAEKPRRFRLF